MRLFSSRCAAKLLAGMSAWQVGVCPAAAGSDCISGQPATVTGVVTEAFETEDGYGLAIQQNSVVSADNAFASCAVAAIESDEALPASCLPGATVSAHGMLFFANPPVRLSADRLNCEPAAGTPTAADSNTLDQPPPLRATPRDRQWMEDAAKAFDAIRVDPARQAIYCDMKTASANRTGIMGTEQEWEKIWALRDRLGPEYYQAAKRQTDLPPKISATVDFDVYRNAWNALVETCPAANNAWGERLEQTYHGYFRVKSGRFDLSYDPTLWTKLQDLSDKDYYEGGALDEDPTELGIRLTLPSQSKKGSDLDVDIDGIPSNRSAEDQRAYLIDKFGKHGQFQIRTIGHFTVLEWRDERKGELYIDYYFQGPKYGILLSAKGPVQALKRISPHVETLIKAIRVK